MVVLVNIAILLGMVIAVMYVPIIFFESFRSRPGTTLLLTLLSLFVLVGAAMSFDRLFPGCRTPMPYWPSRHFYYRCDGQGP
jgi:hypothetical protein